MQNAVYVCAMIYVVLYKYSRSNFFVWVFIQLGLHDLIQDTWQEKVKEKKSISKQVHKKTERQRPPIPRAPLSKQLIYKESGKPIEQEEQTATLESGNKSGE